MVITPVLEGDGSPSVPVEPLRPSFARTAPQTRHLLALLRFRKVHFPHGQLVSGLCGSVEDGVVSATGISSSKTLKRLGRRLGAEGGESGLSGATSLRLLGTGILCGPGDSGSDGSGLGESGSRRGPEACSSEPGNAAGSGTTSGTTRASGGILGKDNLRGPPQAEQELDTGVLSRVQRGQLQPVAGIGGRLGGVMSSTSGSWVGDPASS